MKKSMMKKLMKTILTGLLVLSTAAVCAGCGAKKEEEEEPKTFVEVTDEGLAAHFSDEKNAGVAGGSGITIREGEYLVIDNQLTKGSVHVTVTAGGDDIEKVPTGEDTPATIDYVFDENGGVTEYHEISPGSYMVMFSVEKDAAGTMYANVKTAE